MDRRMFFGALASGFLAGPLTAEAQQVGKTYRLGHIAADGVIPEPFIQGLKEFGWVERQNIVFERRKAKTDEVQQVAAELVRLGVDLIVVPSAGWAEQVQKETRTIPIVLLSAGELGSSGLVASLTHPGGNITGMQIYSPELMGKRLQLLRDVAPKLTRVVVLRGVPYPPKLLAVYRQATDDAARTLGITARYVEFQGAEELPGLFADMPRMRDEAVLVWANPLTTAHRTQILDLAIKYRLPTIGEHGLYKNALIVYGPKLGEVFRHAATYVDRIFKGANPGDLPIGQPTTFELFINLKTAKALGLTIPPSLLQRADQVIE